MSTRTDALDGLLALTVVLGEDMRTSLARDGLTPSRAHVLWLLHHGGPTTQRAIADALGVSARNVTGLVDGLVAGGFVGSALTGMGGHSARMPSHSISTFPGRSG